MDNSVLPLKAVILEISQRDFNRLNQVSTFKLKKTLHAMGRFTLILWYTIFLLLKTLLWLWNVEK